jgi:hypothetical protein
MVANLAGPNFTNARISLYSSFKDMSCEYRTELWAELSVRIHSGLIGALP